MKMEKQSFDKPTTKDLKKYYEYIYKCKCGERYGSDEIEEEPHKCPICEEKEFEKKNRKCKVEDGE